VVWVGTAYMYTVYGYFYVVGFFLKIWYKLYIYTAFIYTICCGCLCVCTMLRWFITIYACIAWRSMISTVTNISRTRMNWSNMWKL
jgi:hypothetical protein